MRRREALKLGLLGGLPSLLGGALRSGGRSAQGPEFPLAVKNGKVWLERTWQTLDIGITSEGKLHLSRAPLRAREAIDARGMVVSPGFIDILGDNASDRTRTQLIFEKYKVADGVTTVLEMHGGTDDVGRYALEMGRLSHQVNYGASTKVMLVRARHRSLKERRLRVERCLAEGALGVSHSLEYQPDTSFEEMVVYAGLAKAYERPLFLHLRWSDEENELAGVAEALRLAETTGAQLHIDHLNSTGGTFHMAEALDLIREANRSGLEVTCCVYPYSYWATYLNSDRFGPGWQDRYHLTYGDLTVIGRGERLTEETFKSYRRQPGIVVAVPAGTMPLPSTVDLALRQDFCLVGSDGGIQSEPKANNHPRGAGCFATAIRHGLGLGLPLEKVLEKMTALPARLLRPALDGRGVLKDGAAADLTVFDPGRIDGTATVENPNQFSTGIEAVIVNGVLAYHRGKLKGRAGRPVRVRPAGLA